MIILGEIGVGHDNLARQLGMKRGINVIGRNGENICFNGWTEGVFYFCFNLLQTCHIVLLEYIFHSDFSESQKLKKFRRAYHSTSYIVRVLQLLRALEPSAPTAAPRNLYNTINSVPRVSHVSQYFC